MVKKLKNQLSKLLMKYSLKINIHSKFNRSQLNPEIDNVFNISANYNYPNSVVILIRRPVSLPADQVSFSMHRRTACSQHPNQPGLGQINFWIPIDAKNFRGDLHLDR